ncbi:MAG: T9SS type A sorting domain-containing protein, partial [Ginsengibacter sp.]
VGSACYTPDIFTLKGSGDDIGGTADAFRFALKTVVGDGEFDARILSLDNANPLNKCGIMIRETLSPGSKYVFIGFTSGNGGIFQSRSTTDGNTSTVNTPATFAAPCWIILIKRGSIYSPFISTDGISYSAFGNPIDAGFGSDPVYAGLAITSHDNTTLSTGTVDNYVFTSGVLPLKLLSFNASLNLAHKVDIKWSATQEMKTSYFVIERSNSDNHFKAIDSVKATNNGTFTSTYNTTDNSPMGGINFYRLKIVDIDGHVSYSALVMVRVNNSKAPILYPNPAKTVINIAQGTDPMKYITIYDITGKVLIRLKAPNTSDAIQVSTSNLMKGTYIVEITTAANIYRDKLLIQ